MHSAIELLVAPIIVFLAVVCPIWLVLHYFARARRDRMMSSAPVSGDDQELIGRMIGLLEKMESRIGTLESILDAEHPRWRDRLKP